MAPVSETPNYEYQSFDREMLPLISHFLQGADMRIRSLIIIPLNPESASPKSGSNERKSSK